MEPTYVLWHTQRQGWVSNAGTSTEFNDAKKFGRREAMAYCTRQVSHDQIPGVVPVSIYDMGEIFI